LVTFVFGGEEYKEEKIAHNPLERGTKRKKGALLVCPLSLQQRKRGGSTITMKGGGRKKKGASNSNSFEVGVKKGKEPAVEIKKKKKRRVLLLSWKEKRG